jgi:Cd2+/Zn2+-exporting ATPase
MGDLDVIAFDKTGTVTEGQATVAEVIPFQGVEEDRLLAQAAAVERLSEHPLGRAIVEAAEARGLALPEARDLRNQRGLGAVAQVDGKAVAVGRRSFVAAHGGVQPGEEEAAGIEALSRQGRTVVFVAGSGLGGAIVLEDQVRPEARKALEGLRAAGVEKTLLLTGDNAAVAERVARQVGFDQWRADLLPEEKVSTIQELQLQGARVAMVGDGVNDAPALAAASLGVAMGVAGTDAALETADLVLVQDELGQIAYAVRLARRTRRIVRQNLAFACGVIALLVVINLAHGLSLPLGVVGHEGSTLLVVLNGLRLLRPLDGSPARKES